MPAELRGCFSLLRFAAAARLALFCASSCFLLAGCSRSPPPPKLVLPESPLHLGEGTPREELTGVVSLKNEGGEVLHIEKLESGCQCSSLNLAQDKILPGDRVILKVAARMKSDGQNLLFPVRIFSNDPATPAAVFMVQADAGPPVLLTEPSSVNFGEVAIGSSAALNLSIFKPDRRPWPRTENARVDSTFGAVRAEPARLAKGSADNLVLEVRPRSDLPLGSFEDTLTIRPANSQRTVQVAVRGKVVPPIVASPSTLYFGDVDPKSEPMKRTVLLRRADGKDLSRLLKTTAPPGIKVQESKTGTQESKARQLLISLDQTAIREDLKDGKLLLWLENEQKPVAIGVMVFLSRKVVAKSE